MNRETLNQSPLLVLRDLMGKLDVTWSFDHDANPVHAVFEYPSASEDRAYRCNAALGDQALRLSIQAFLKGEPTTERLQALDEVNAQWGMGRVYYDESHGHFDLTIGLYLGAGLPGPNLLRETLTHLIESGPKIGRLEAPKFQSKLAICPPCTVTDIHEVLSSQGLSPTTKTDRDLVGLRLTYSEMLDIVMEFQVDEFQVLRVGVLENNPVGITDEETIFRSLQDINRGLNFGTMFFDRGNGRCVYSMSIPLAWFTFDEAMARWLVQQASRVMIQLKKDMHRS
jgi:hypothetical protein